MNKHFFACLGVGALLLTACHPKESTASIDQPIPVEIQCISATGNQTTITYVGKVEADALNLSFAMGGKLTSLKVQNNQIVHKGDIIATVEDTQAKNALSLAQASLQQAQDAYERVKTVYDQGGVSPMQWVELQSKLQQAQAMVNTALKNVEDCTLRAPKDGVITHCESEVGALLVPSQRLASLLDLSTLSIAFAVPESERAELKIGDTLQVVIPAVADSTLEAVISQKGLVGDAVVHTYEFKADLVRPLADCMPGMVCKVKRITAESENQVVPATCILLYQNSKAVWVMQNGRAVRREIVTGAYLANGVEVKSGLQVGDSVVVSGYQKLYAGRAIEPVQPANGGNVE